jgi:hypothetical protein
VVPIPSRKFEQPVHRIEFVQLSVNSGGSPLARLLYPANLSPNLQHEAKKDGPVTSAGGSSPRGTGEHGNPQPAQSALSLLYIVTNAADSQSAVGPIARHSSPPSPRSLVAVIDRWLNRSAQQPAVAAIGRPYFVGIHFDADKGIDSKLEGREVT